MLKQLIFTGCHSGKLDDSQIWEILSLNLLFTFTELCANAAENMLRRLYYHYLTFT